ncbi:MAG: YidC/Oxa1 family membrane protein insertase [Solobacterium sp.]|nr:YidC/Oxa1 family membrane protein insertase [Solobacterium sp.]
MEYIYKLFADVMHWCYGLCGNYGIAIFLFTFLSKIILLPISVWTYFNSITMIKIQPDVNFLKVRYFGMKDELGEAQNRLFKEKGYHPLLSTIPLVLQIFLLLGVTAAIRAGINDPAIDTTFCGVDLSIIPYTKGMQYVYVPLLAGLSSLILSVAQNHSNVLQSEQSLWNKYGTMVFSVGLSLYLGWYVSIGVALYWVFSNLFAVLQMYILNFIVRPRRFIDYDRLEESRKQLDLLQKSADKKESWFSANRKKERADYKRFFSIGNKHIVFYSERGGFYKYFRAYIDYLLENTRIPIHYVTSDPKDPIFEMAKTQPRILPYYISDNKLITFMMKMDAQMVVMTMPDLETYHIKRSLVRNDVKYVFVQHGIGSNNMGMRKGCVDHFDVVFNAGPHQREEVEKTEALYNLPKKVLVDAGYPLIDEMRAQYDASEHTVNKKKKILIAPSWQNDNIIDSCLETILDQLKGHDYDVIVRPHPQEVRLKKQYMEQLKKVYEPQGIEIQTDFTSNNPILEADLLITDWSGISWEFAFTTRRPILFIDTPMKVMNPDYQKIDTVPLNILIRDKLGKHLKTDELDRTAETAAYLLDHTDEYHTEIEALAHQYLYHLDHSAEVGGAFLVDALRNLALYNTIEDPNAVKETPAAKETAEVKEEPVPAEETAAPVEETKETVTEETKTETEPVSEEHKEEPVAETADSAEEAEVTSEETKEETAEEAAPAEEVKEETVAEKTKEEAVTEEVKTETAEFSEEKKEEAVTEETASEAAPAEETAAEEATAETETASEEPKEEPVTETADTAEETEVTSEETKEETVEEAAPAEEVKEETVAEETKEEAVTEESAEEAAPADETKEETVTEEVSEENKEESSTEAETASDAAEETVTEEKKEETAENKTAEEAA